MKQQTPDNKKTEDKGVRLYSRGGMEKIIGDAFDAGMIYEYCKHFGQVPNNYPNKVTYIASLPQNTVSLNGYSESQMRNIVAEALLKGYDNFSFTEYFKNNPPSFAQSTGVSAGEEGNALKKMVDYWENKYGLSASDHAVYLQILEQSPLPVQGYSDYQLTLIVMRVIQCCRSGKEMLVSEITSEALQYAKTLEPSLPTPAKD